MRKRKRTSDSFVAVWRERQGVSQFELADLLGVNVLTVSRWERDFQSAPPFLYLALEALERRLAAKKPAKK